MDPWQRSEPQHSDVLEELTRTLRSTIWRMTPDGWQAEYHQGTVVSD